MNIYESGNYQKSRSNRHDYFIPENLLSCEIISSDSIQHPDKVPKGYLVCVETYKTSENGWNFTRLTVVNTKTNKRNAMSIERNYHSIDFIFCKFKGKLYLVSGEDYQGITVLNLTDNIRNTYIPEKWKSGCGWCISEFTNWNEKGELTAEGCLWGCDYTTRTFTITDLDNISLEDYVEVYHDNEYQEIDEDDMTEEYSHGCTDEF